MCVGHGAVDCGLLVGQSWGSLGQVGQMTSKLVPQTLYRFFDKGDELLYIGLTADVGRRVAQHRDGRPWWVEVVRITLEQFPDRRSVIEAERNAIKTERPKYNVTHNGGRASGDGTAISSDRDHVRFGLEVGFVVALITDLPTRTKCYVGEVQAIDDLGVRVTLVDWIIGDFCREDLFVPWVHLIGAAVWTEEHSIDRGDLARWQNDVHREPEVADSAPAARVASWVPPAEVGPLSEWLDREPS